MVMPSFLPYTFTPKEPSSAFLFRFDFTNALHTSQQAGSDALLQVAWHRRTILCAAIVLGLNVVRRAARPRDLSQRKQMKKIKKMTCYRTFTERV